MATVQRPDGAQIYYEVEGSGPPILLFAPGGVSSEVWFWRNVSVLNPFDLADEFTIIGMNQRHSTDSPGDLVAPDWATYAADQRAVLDDLGIERTMLWGGCIGVGFCLRFIMEAPDRVIAAVGQDPVGLVEGFNSRATFSAMFEPTIELARSEGMASVVAAAATESIFSKNHEAGPWSARTAVDDSFRQRLLDLDPDDYAELVRAWDNQMWGAHGPFMSVDEATVASIETPLLIIPGSDPFHPTATSERICREAPNAICLDVDCRSDAKVNETRTRVRTFFRECASADAG